MSITFEQYSSYANDKNRDVVVSRYLLASDQYDHFFVYCLVPLYKDRPTKQKAIVMHDIFLKEDAPYRLNFGPSCRELQTLHIEIVKYESEIEDRKDNRKIWSFRLFKRIDKPSEARARGDLFDPMVAYIERSHLGAIQLLGNDTSKKTAGQIVSILLTCGFAELKKLCY